MYDAYNFIYLAVMLSSLTYYLGSLFYALPIPIFGIKRWAPRLIQDGIYTTILATVWLLLLAVTQYFMGLLGVSWSSFYAWSNQVINTEFAIQLEIQALYGIVSSVGGPAAPVLLSPLSVFSSIIYIAITTFESIISISTIVYNNVAVLVALGVMLMAIPFRIGRVIGASLLASSLVFVTGIPYMPVFVNYTVGSISSIDLQATNSSQLGQVENELALVVIPSLIDVVVIGPLIYMGILGGLSIGLASLLSGSIGRLPFRIDIL
jgi:hypothetical protein